MMPRPTDIAREIRGSRHELSNKPSEHGTLSMGFFEMGQDEFRWRGQTNGKQLEIEGTDADEDEECEKVGDGREKAGFLWIGIREVRRVCGQKVRHV